MPAISNRQMLANVLLGDHVVPFLYRAGDAVLLVLDSSYLYSARHLSMLDIGIVGWIPFLMGDVGGVLVGWAAGVLLRRGRVDRREKSIFSV